METKELSSSSEQLSCQPLNRVELPVNSVQKKVDIASEKLVNLNSHDLETEHFITQSNDINLKTSPVGSSCLVDKNSSKVCRINDTVEYSENSFKERSPNSKDDTHCPLSTSMLEDDSFVEFSLNEEKNLDIENSPEISLKQTSKNIHHENQSISESVSEKNPETTGPAESRNKTEQCLGNITEAFAAKAPAQSQITSSCLQNEIEMILSTTAALCSPDSDFEISKVELSSASKENLMRMLSDLLAECDWLKKEKVRLENEVDRMEADCSSQAYSSQIEALEKSLAQAQADACSWEEKFQMAEQKYIAENVKIRSNLTTRLERVTKQYEAANKDKEAMVVKYATSEREVIVAKKQKEAVEKKMTEMERERENLISKNKMLISERVRICQTLDTKVQSNNWYQREVDRLKNEISGRDIKIKWAQTKLKSEMDAHQECQGKLDRALTKIMKHEDELKTIKEEAENFVRTTKQDENSRANVLDMQLKEEKARLIMERQANEDRDSAFSKLMAECEELKVKHQSLEEEAASLRNRVASRELEQGEMEKLFTSLRAEVTSARQEASDLNHQLSNSAHHQQQLTRVKEQLECTSKEVDQLQHTNNELESELLACRHKEAELLAFTQKLSDKNVQIQSQLSALQSKAQLMEIEHDELKAELDDLKILKSKLKAELTKEKQKHNTQMDSLNQQLIEKTREAQHLATSVHDLENEIQVLKRKHNNALKDITREMQKLRRRLDHQENGSNEGNESASGGVSSGRSSQSATPHDSLSQGSRASSNTSLNTLEYHNGISPHTQDQLPPLSEPLVTQQLLVNRIVKLQKAAEKRAEKMEFLEEHNAQLVEELKKKSRIIHHYILREEAGALANSASDLSKAELMRHGGIMASVYGSAPRDGTMTLELSLEINRKLQAVLEDTLLKNITLKENLNTLGDEIAKISLQTQMACQK